MAVVDACSEIMERMWDVEMVGWDSEGGSIVIIEVEGERL